jgi:malate synthase
MKRTGAWNGREDPTFQQLLEEEYDKLLKANTRDVHDSSKDTTLPVAKEIAKVYVTEQQKIPWFIDLLNINLNNDDLGTARERIDKYLALLKTQNDRITENLDFGSKG